MTVIDTQPPQGNADFGPSTQYAGYPLAVDTQAGVTLYNTAVGLVGSAPSIEFVTTINPGPWTFEVQWQTSQTFGTGVVAQDLYSGDAATTVNDILPARAPYCFFVYSTSLGGGISFTLNSWASNVTGRFQPTNRFYDAAVSIEATAFPGTTTTDNFAKYLTPGLYNYSCYVTTALTGQLRIVSTQGGAIVSRHFQTLSPPALTAFNGQCVIGRILPSFQVNNTGAGAITAYLSLVGPV